MQADGKQFTIDGNDDDDDDDIYDGEDDDEDDVQLLDDGTFVEDGHSFHEDVSSI